ncbi:reverse transcriptase zinc-binding domain-containing protein [Artemisia annua]|uniref:Reverse transcriptase zinc-binding domain-containing protein n=1 Tax=Artemisia annua TaxID=35608 RepID=A0A2U1MW27_ARTAN|nr:reverse transcriptase zinc-binding domain-containing protein [Artemisia annua]
MVIAEVLRNGVWGWPCEWYEKYPIFNQVQTMTLSDNNDELMWKSKKGIMGKFSIKPAYNDLQTEEESVKWNKLVWYSQNIPKHAFILWLAIQNKLYAKQFWFKVCLKMGVHWNEMEWDNTVNLFAAMENGNTITSIIRRLCLVASVYLIWRERNCRLFKEETRSVEELFEVFSDTIRFRLASLKAKPTSAVIRAQDDWNVQMVILSFMIFQRDVKA